MAEDKVRAYWWDFPQGFSIIDFTSKTRIHSIKVGDLKFRSIILLRRLDDRLSDNQEYFRDLFYIRQR